MRWLTLALVACATPPTIEKGAVEQGAVEQGRAAVTVPGDAALVTPPVKPKVGPPGAVNGIAGPEDADFVVTNGGSTLRLWPTLDGSREPLIIPTLRAQLEIEAIRDGDDIAVASRDTLGQLEIVRFRHDGVVLSDLDVELERPAIALASTPHGFIVVRDDQRLVAFDAHGVARGQIDPPPGLRFERVVERSGRVLAVFTDARNRLAGRMLELDERGLAWGVATARLAIDPTLLALSPSGTQVIGIRDHWPAVVELATGKQVIGGRPSALDNTREIDPSMVAFADDHTIWFTQDQVTYERPLTGAPSPLPQVLSSIHGTAHAIVAPVNGSLMITANHDSRFLGYRIDTIKDLIADRHGWVASDGVEAMHFDATFALDRIYPDPELVNTTQGLTLLDARHVMRFNASEVLVVDLATNTATDAPFMGTMLRFERSTGLAQFSTDQGREFAQWEPARGKFASQTVRLPGTGYPAFELYDPVATGFVAATADYGTDQAAELTLYRSVDVAKAEPFRTTKRLVPPPPHNPDFEDFSVVLPHKGRSIATRDRSLILDMLDNRITLHDRAGNVRWMRTSRGATGYAWNADDELVAYGQGLANVDLDTGELADARCGWEFGLWDETPAGAVGAAALCEER